MVSQRAVLRSSVEDNEFHRVSEEVYMSDQHHLELIDVMRELYNLSGFRITVHDIDFKEIFAYPKEPLPFCRLIRAAPESYRCCKDCDYAAFHKVRASGEACVYRCHVGLHEAVVPIYSFGILSGYMMMGQAIDPSPLSVERTRAAALSFIRDEKLINEMIEQIPVRNETQIRSCISIMEVCAAYITLTNQLRSGTLDLATQARQYLDENYASKITLEMLCETLYCSRATLTSTFRSAHGCSVGEYLAQVRVEAAQQLLRETKLSFDDIAARCGFSDRGYFAKVFKRRCGMTPGEYRDTQ